jgi:hypothetical protein
LGWTVLTGLLVVLTVVLLSLLVSTGPTIRLVTSGAFVFITACFFVGRVLGTSNAQRHYTITLTPEEIAGPSAWAGRHIIFPRATLDRARSCTVTVLQRVGGYRYLWSTAGHKIRVNVWALGQAEVRRLLTQVGCIEERSPS